MRGLGLDIGISNTDYVYASENGDVGYHSVARAADAVQIVKQVVHSLNVPEGSTIAVTGVGASALPSSVDGHRLQRISEFAAVGQGAQLLAGERASSLVISAGSGTAMVHAEADRYTHLGGTGLGGATVMGLAALLLSESDPSALSALAQQGDKKRIDLSIGDVHKGDLGQLPADYTAVNFGKLARAASGKTGARREDLAAALLVLAAEVAAVLAVAHARALQVRRIVVVGNMTRSDFWCRALERIVSGFGCQLLIPQQAGRAAALGALKQAH